MASFSQLPASPCEPRYGKIAEGSLEEAKQIARKLETMLESKGNGHVARFGVLYFNVVYVLSCYIKLYLLCCILCQ